MTFQRANKQAFERGERSFEFNGRRIATWNPKTGETLSGLKRAIKVTGKNKHIVKIPDNISRTERNKLIADANKQYGQGNWVMGSTTSMKQDAQNAEAVKSKNTNNKQSGSFQNRVKQAVTQKKNTQQQARAQERKNHTTNGDTHTGITVTATKSRQGNRSNNTGWVPVDISSWEGFKENPSTNSDGSPILNNARVWQNMQTGEYRVADNKGNIIGSAFSKEQAKKAAFDHYNIYSDKQLARNMAADERGKEVREASKKAEGYNPSKELLAQVVQNQHKGLEYTAAAINKGLRYPLAAGWGLVRTAADPNYTLKDWYTKDFNPLAGTTEDLLQGNSGAGDVLVGVGTRFGADPNSNTSEVVRFVGNIGGDMLTTNLISGRGIRLGQNKGKASIRPVKQKIVVDPDNKLYGNGQFVGQIDFTGSKPVTGTSANGKITITPRKGFLSGETTATEVGSPTYTGNRWQRFWHYGPNKNSYRLGTDMQVNWGKGMRYFDNNFRSAAGHSLKMNGKPGYVQVSEQGYRPFIESNLEPTIVIPTLPHMVPTIVQQPVETLQISNPGVLYKPADNWHKQQYLTGEMLPTNYDGGTKDLQDRSRVLNNGQVRLGLNGNGNTYSTGVFYGPSQYE